MNNILDRFSIRSSQLQPKTTAEMFALRLAQKLGEAAAAQHYVSLVDRYPEAQLLLAYRRMLRSKRDHDPARFFHKELERSSDNSYHNGHASLIAIRIERRTIAAAIFQGNHLEYTDSRQLASTREKAVVSAVGFISWMLQRFPVESAAVEAIPSGQQVQREVLFDNICTVLRTQTLSIWEVSRSDLLGACAHPPLKSRAELRAIATTIWPILSGTHAKVFMQDAAMLGLHIQMERLFLY